MIRAARKLSVLLLVLVLLVGLLPVGAFAAESTGAEVKGRVLHLGADLTLRLYASIEDAYKTDGVVTVSVGNQVKNTYNVNEMTAGENGYYEFCANFAAAQITETITLRLVSGGNEVYTYETTAKDYLEDLLQYETATASDKRLALQLMTYGAAAQQYFGYKEDTLANAGYELTSQVTVPEALSPVIKGSVDGVSFYGASMLLQDVVSLRLYFNVPGGDVSGYTFKVDGEECTPTAKSGMYKIDVPCNDPHKMDVARVITVTDGSGNTLTVEYSPMNYISRMYAANKDNAESAALCNMLLAATGYFEEAKTYTGAQPVYVDKRDSGNIAFTLSSAEQAQVSGKTLAGATVGSTAFTTATYANGVVTLDRATVSALSGKQTVVLNFGDVTLDVTAYICEMVIETTDDLVAFPTISKNALSGYYALGANIDMDGISFANTNGDDYEFTGTFDGRGYTVSNFCPKSSATDWAGGLFGKHFNGTLKDVSFVDAIVKGQGSFLACKGNGGTLENVYMRVIIDGLVSSYTTNGWINNTSIFFNITPASAIQVKNVVLEYAEPLTDNNGWGYAVGLCNTGTVKPNGFYIVGADKGANSGVTATTCYADRDAFDADVSSWDGNGFWTVVDGYPVPNEVLNMPAEPEEEIVDLTGITNVETGAAGTTFTVNFGDNKAAVEGATLTAVTVDGTAFTTKSYADGVLNLDLATVKSMTGEKTVIATFAKGEQTIIVNAKVLLCTQVIDSASELAALPAVMKANPAGYFVLANDIDMAGVAYENTNTDAFTGTFDGQGYTIYNMTSKKTADDWDGGFFGKLFKGTLKNISFANATVKGQGAFLAFRGVTAKLENVYMYVRFADRVAGLGWINDSSVLFNDGENNYIYATNVVIEYAEALPENSGSGYPLYGNFNVSQINGLYVIGADKISVNTLDGSSTKYACYADRAAFNADVSSWDGNGFWTVVDGFPVPNRLVGVDLSGPVESSLDISGVHAVGLQNSGTTFTVNFGSQADALAGTTLISATVGDTLFTTKAYAGGVLTLDKAALGTELGEKAITVVFENDEKRITVNVTVKTYTMTIASAADLQAFPGVAGTVKDGYYVLTADIDMDGKTFANTNGGGGDSDAFTGTFDGQGYTVFNFCSKSSATDWAGGLFGKNFKGTLKNVSFVNAIVNGQGSFLACKGHGGTLENVYFRVEVQNLVSNTNWVNNTSILFNTTPSSTIQVKNVILEYAAPLTGNNGWGYAVGECGVGAITDNGFYILGADKTAANNGDNATACYTDRMAFKAAVQDLSAWDGNGFWTVKDGFPIPNRLVGTQWEAEPKQEITIDLESTYYVQNGISGDTFTVDLSAHQDALAGTTLSSATVGDASFTTKSYADGVLTLDKATAGTQVGAKEAVVIFESGNKRVTVNVDLFVCTMAIATSTDMQNFPTVLAANLAGHFVLANDIDMNGVAFTNSVTDTVTATFDGQGYTVSNMATKTAADDWDGGLFGKMFQGKLMNIVFDNAIVKGKGAFLAFRGNNSTLENVYIEVTFDGLVDTNGFTEASSVLYNDCQYGYVYVNNVIIEYAQPLTATYGGYTIFQDFSISKFNGLYIIGADKVTPDTLTGSSTAYGCYTDRAALKAAGIDFSSWYAGGFWAEHATDLIPVPASTVN